MTAVPQFYPVSSDDPTSSNNEECLNDLAIAPENADEFDALNDETFGDATFDEDWEQQHEQLASIDSGSSLTSQQQQQQHQQQLHHHQLLQSQAASNIQIQQQQPQSHHHYHQQPQKISLLERDFHVNNENNDSGWTPFSMDGFAFNIKPTMNVNDDKNRPFAPIIYGKPGSGDSLPHIVQTKLPAGFAAKPSKPMTLDEVERLLKAENSGRSDNADAVKPVDKSENPLTKFFPGVDLSIISNQEKKHLPQNVPPVPLIPISESNVVRPFMFQPPVLPGFRPFNQQIPPAVGLPRMSIPPFLPYLQGQILNPTLQLEQIQQFQRRFPHQRRQFHPRQGGRYHDRNDDEYAGLMTQSNKEWLIKIQSSALNFTNQYKEDYYYVSFKARQLTAAAKAKKGDDSSQLPSVIIPERKVEESTIVEYVPVQFEGSLGKIQVANIKCPRKLLDVDFKQSSKIIDPSQDRPATPVGRAELNAFRRLLLDIEHLYGIMLDIDEEDKKMGALPEDQRTPHAVRRRDLCNQLFRGVYDEKAESINKRIASVRKGVALIVRSLQVLSDPNQKAVIVKSLLDPNNSHLITNYREKGLHQLDAKEVLLDILTQLRESKLPEVDNLTNSLNTLAISRHPSS